MATITLDVDAVRAFAQARHAASIFRSGPPCHADPTSVGAEAYSLAQMYYRHRYDDEPVRNKDTARCAGLLVYAMERYGCSFETICEQADARTAQALEYLTPDMRLPLSQRSVEQLKTTTKAPAVVQLVRLAEIRCTLRRLLNLPESLFVRNADAIRRWYDDSHGLVSALAKCKIGENTAVAAVLKHTRDQLWKALMQTEKRRRDILRSQLVPTTDDDETVVEAPVTLPLNTVNTDAVLAAAK